MNFCGIVSESRGGETVDAAGLGPVGSNPVGVQVPSPAREIKNGWPVRQPFFVRRLLTKTVK